MNDQTVKPKKIFFLRQLLRSAPPAPRIKDKTKVDQQYRYWRWRTLYSMYIGYAIFYFTRKSFTFAMPVMLQVLPMTKADLGFLSTAFYMIYGISKFFSGMLSDRSSPRYFMAFGLIATGIANILFGFSNSMLFLSLFWCINAFFQGWGWPPCARLLTHWYSKNERGRWWGIWNTSHNVGGALIPLLIASILMTWGSWKLAMIIPGGIAILMGLLIMNRLRDVPTSLGLPPIEEYHHDYQSKRLEKESPKMSTGEILVKYIIRNKYIWLLAISYIFIYIVRTAINDWGAVYLNEKGASIFSANAVMAFFEVGGFVGSLAAGWLSDVVCKGRRGPVNVAYSLACLGVVFWLWCVPDKSLVLHAELIFAIGFLVFGPQMLIGIAAAELTHKESAGTATGFVGLFGYLGAALSGWPIGWVIQHFHWSGFFMTIALCSVLSVLFLIPLYSANERPRLKGVDY